MKTMLPLLLCWVLSAGCAKPAETALAPLVKDEINAEKLWQRITVESPYERYAFLPGHEELRPGQAPHGKYHEVYVNSVYRQALPIKERVAPEGSIVVKKNFNAEKKHTNFTIMAKVRGFDPENGDWFWAMYEAGGKVRGSGKMKGCLDCHSGVKDNDFLVIRRLDQPVEAARK